MKVDLHAVMIGAFVTPAAFMESVRDFIGADKSHIYFSRADAETLRRLAGLIVDAQEGIRGGGE